MPSPRHAVALAALIGLLSAVSRCGDVAEARGYCAKSCTKTADCCPDGVPGCPGDYPENFACEHGLCRAPVCEKDADCRFLGDTATLGCRSVSGRVGCVFLCSSDADCKMGGLGPSTCGGKTDDGARICGGSLPRCSSDADCLGSFHCVDGACACRDDADCPKGHHCQGGACGCATDAECGPNLDACTTDPAFAYPPSAAPGKPPG